MAENQRPELTDELMKEAYLCNQQIEDMNQLKRDERSNKKFADIAGWIGLSSLAFTIGGLLLQGFTGDKQPGYDIACGGVYGYLFGMLGNVIGTNDARKAKEKIRQLEIK